MERPNVLLICTDHWSANMLRIAGHPVIHTPTLDQLSRNGVRFTRAYSACPICIPARRGLMTGMSPRRHGCRQYDSKLEMTGLTTMAESFAEAGYQTSAVGKLHVYPQRDRIGFHEVALNEEGRHLDGMDMDDYEQFLADEGYLGQQFVHGMSNNQYSSRPWHLPEYAHPTNWTVREMCRNIKRRDPRRPSFWYMSFVHPHPPLVPLSAYLDMYRDVEMPDAPKGEWAADAAKLPFPLRTRLNAFPPLDSVELGMARRAVYALCTHIDHQLRLVIGTLREEGLLKDTIICFTSDHGDLLGDHGMFQKALFYERAINIPLIIVPTANSAHFDHHTIDDRLVELSDIMPTLLEMAGINVPQGVDGISLLRDERRQYLYGEYGEGAGATRMVRDDRYKLIYYASGNHVQLFDLQTDPQELHNVADDPAFTATKEQLLQRLVDNLYGGDERWIENDRLVGLPGKTGELPPNRDLNGQRGWH